MSEVRREDIIVEDVGQQYISRPRMCYIYRPHQHTGCATEIPDYTVHSVVVL